MGGGLVLCVCLRYRHVFDFVISFNQLNSLISLSYLF